MTETLTRPDEATEVHTDLDELVNRREEAHCVVKERTVRGWRLWRFNVRVVSPTTACQRPARWSARVHCRECPMTGRWILCDQHKNETVGARPERLRCWHGHHGLEFTGWVAI